MTRQAVRERAVDAGLFVVAAGVTALTLLDGLEQGIPRIPLTVDIALGGLSCLGVWLRRHRPIVFAVVVGILSVYSTSASGVALIALGTVAVHCGFRVLAAVVAGYAAVPFLTLLVRPDIPVAPGWQVVAGVACVATVLAWGMFIRARRQSMREQARRVESEQELRVAQIRQAERNRIAREMHDVLAHRLSLLSLHAGALELRPDAEPGEVARAAGVIRDNAYQALEDLREVIGMLRAEPAEPDPARPQPGFADVPELVEQSRRAGMLVALDFRLKNSDVVPGTAGRNAYRIIQEGLTNARKHARDAHVTVAVGGACGDGLTVEIRNPCAAGDAAVATIPGGGSGLIGLRERASLAGGRLEHGHTGEGEFRLWAWLPWQR